jgi:hypothetical protein
LVTDRPSKQFGIEARQGIGVRRFDRASPPHTLRPSPHVLSVSQVGHQADISRSPLQQNRTTTRLEQAAQLPQRLLGVMRLDESSRARARTSSRGEPEVLVGDVHTRHHLLATRVTAQRSMSGLNNETNLPERSDIKN